MPDVLQDVAKQAFDNIRRVKAAYDFLDGPGRRKAQEILRRHSAGVFIKTDSPTGVSGLRLAWPPEGFTDDALDGVSVVRVPEHLGRDLIVRPETLLSRLREAGLDTATLASFLNQLAAKSSQALQALEALAQGKQFAERPDMQAMAKDAIRRQARQAFEAIKRVRGLHVLAFGEGQAVQGFAESYLRQHGASIHVQNGKTGPVRVAWPPDNLDDAGGVQVSQGPMTRIVRDPDQLYAELKALGLQTIAIASFFGRLADAADEAERALRQALKR